MYVCNPSIYVHVHVCMYSYCCRAPLRLSARHPNPATRSHLALYVCMYMYVCMSVTLWNAITYNCGAGPEGWDFVVRAGHV